MMLYGSNVPSSSSYKSVCRRPWAVASTGSSADRRTATEEEIEREGSSDQHSLLGGTQPAVGPPCRETAR